MSQGASFVDLYWLPVGAGTHFQRASLLLYESVAAWVGRRERCTLLHAGLKGSHEGQPFTLEVMPSPSGSNPNNEVTGPVGVKHAGRLRIFRYQVCVNPHAALPDEEWAVEPPVRLTDDRNVVAEILALARRVPAYTWGRRRPGQPEMWTSDSAVAWMLVLAGIEASRIAVPAKCRAPGWDSGLIEAGLKPASPLVSAATR